MRDSPGLCWLIFWQLQNYTSWEIVPKMPGCTDLTNVLSNFLAIQSHMLCSFSKTIDQEN